MHFISHMGFDVQLKIDPPRTHLRSTPGSGIPGIPGEKGEMKFKKAIHVFKGTCDRYPGKDLLAIDLAWASVRKGKWNKKEPLDGGCNENLPASGAMRTVRWGEKRRSGQGGSRKCPVALQFDHRGFSRPVYKG